MGSFGSEKNPIQFFFYDALPMVPSSSSRGDQKSWAAREAAPGVAAVLLRKKNGKNHQKSHRDENDDYKNAQRGRYDGVEEPSSWPISGLRSDSWNTLSWEYGATISI